MNPINPFVLQSPLIGVGASAMAVGGAGAVAGWWAGSSLALTAVGGIAVKLITTVGVSALAPDPPQGGGITLTTTVRGEDHAETIILGRYATGGQAICPEYSHGDSNLYLTRIINSAARRARRFRG